MADHPDPTDIRGWRERLLAASDREERQGVLRAWARACGCEFGEGAAAHVITPPGTLDPIVAAVMHAWATNNGLHLKPPLGSWAASCGVPAPGGGTWHANTVRRVLESS